MIYKILEYKMSLLRGLLPKLPTDRKIRKVYHKFTTTPLHESHWFPANFSAHSPTLSQAKPREKAGTQPKTFYGFVRR